MNNPFPEHIYTQRTTDRTPDVRGDFFRDQTALIHSSAFRRLKNKTQVFFAPQNDHICTRIEHVLHVATVAATICKGLNAHGWNLNVDMAYTIGIGHDIGHSPFGHAGEKALNKILQNTGMSFIHEINSYRVVEYLENKGAGLNLCYGVKDGIICHNGEKDEQYLRPSPTLNDLDSITNRRVVPTSYEGCIMRFSDKIAYLGRDLEDALVAGFIAYNDIPERVRQILGDRNGKIINTLILDVIENSKLSDQIGFSDSTFALVTELKEFNYKYIYSHAELQKYDRFCNHIIKSLYDYLGELLDKSGFDKDDYQHHDIPLDRHFGNYICGMADFYNQKHTPKAQILVDYISGMTDYFALNSIKQITIPEPLHYF